MEEGNGIRLPPRMAIQSSMETTNLEDHQGLFRRLDRPKLLGFDGISEILEIPESNTFVGLNVTNQISSIKTVVSPHRISRLGNRTSMTGLNL